MAGYRARAPCTPAHPRMGGLEHPPGTRGCNNLPAREGYLEASCAEPVWVSFLLLLLLSRARFAAVHDVLLDVSVFCCTLPTLPRPAHNALNGTLEGARGRTADCVRYRRALHAKITFAQEVRPPCTYVRTCHHMGI